MYGYRDLIGSSLLAVFILTVLDSTLVLCQTGFDYDGSYEEEMHDEFVVPDVTLAKADYDRVVSYSNMPQYGQCWSQALTNLHTSCKVLTEKIQMRLAYDFANCFLHKSGMLLSQTDFD